MNGKLAIFGVILLIPVVYAGSSVHTHSDLRVDLIREEVQPMWLASKGYSQIVYADIQHEDWKVLSERGWEITSPGNLYSYHFGVAGQFDHKKIQTLDFHAWLKEIAGWCECPPPKTCTRQDPFPWVSVWSGSPLANGGFERGVKITFCHPLTGSQVGEVKELISKHLTN